MMTDQGRRTAPSADMNHQAFDHEQLKAMTDAADLEATQTFADGWLKMGYRTS